MQSTIVQSPDSSQIVFVFARVSDHHHGVHGEHAPLLCCTILGDSTFFKFKGVHRLGKFSVYQFSPIQSSCIHTVVVGTNQFHSNSASYNTFQ